MKPKKSLGQHFLTSRAVVRDIVRAAHLRADDTVLEIGPGKGILTEALIGRAGKVVAVEKDPALATYLKEKFIKEIDTGRLNLVCSDILTFRPDAYKLQTIHYKLIANIPYYITGEILRHFLSADAQPESMILLIQKEVAERIARSKKESVLSLSVKAYGTPRYEKTVPARYFQPKPKVDSAILSIENISRDFFWSKECSHKRSPLNLEEVFFALVRAGFAHKRKFLASNIKHLFPNDSIPKALALCGIPEKARAEDILLERWRCLATAMFLQS